MVPREDLYRLVWTEPMTKVAERLGVSGSYLARVCSLLNVPRPQRGYWAKLAAGKAPPRASLPPALPGDPLGWSQDGERVAVPKPKAPPGRARAKKARIARTTRHALVRGARAHFEHGRPVDEGAYLKPYKKLLVDVTASLAGLDKALDLANDLFNGLESLGHRVVLASADAGLGGTAIDEREANASPRNRWDYSGLWSPYRPTVAYVGSVAIGLAVVEMSEEVTLRYVKGKYVRESEYVTPHRPYYEDHSWTTNREIPSGRMRIVAYCPYRAVTWSLQWQETRSNPLRSQVRTIIEAIEAMAPEVVAKLEEAEREAEARRQQWLIEEDRRKRAEDRKRVEQSIVDSKLDLHDVIERWANVTGIERFLAGIAERAEHLPEAERSVVIERLALARDFLGTQDPLDFFRDWKTPLERYAPKYGDDRQSGQEGD